MIGISQFLGLVRMLILRWTRRDMTDDVSGALSRREAHGDSTDASRVVMRSRAHAHFLPA